MRTATIVLVAYALCVVLGGAWHLLPFGFTRDAIPDLGALTAAYLGLTARRNVAPAVAGSVVIGYLLDLISGAPAGLLALTLGLTALITRAIQQRILVRGLAMTIAFSAFVALIAQTIALFVRVLHHMPRGSLRLELWHMFTVIIATALIGPLVWRIFRRIDAAFARTHRERDAALEGLTP